MPWFQELFLWLPELSDLKGITYCSICTPDYNVTYTGSLLCLLVSHIHALYSLCTPGNNVMCTGITSLSVHLLQFVHCYFRTLLHAFLCPSLKGLQGASRSSSVCTFVRNSVPLTYKVQYLKFGWSYSYQTWTVSPFKGCSHFIDITCPWGWGGVKCRT